MTYSYEPLSDRRIPLELRKACADSALEAMNATLRLVIAQGGNSPLKLKDAKSAHKAGVQRAAAALKAMVPHLDREA